MKIYHFSKTINIAPITIKIIPKKTFKLKVSPKISTESMIIKTELNLSITATWLAGPNLSAQKEKSQERAPKIPAKTIKSQSLEEKAVKEKFSNFFKNKLVVNKNPAIIKDLIVVAKVESIFLSPNLPNMATKLAVNAESKANSI
jgi:hypothetical protein